MPGYEDRASILQGAGDMIFKLVCERATREQWAEWLRAPLEHAAGTANHDLVKKLLEAGADGSAGWRGCDGKTLLHAGVEGGDACIISALTRAGAGADMKAKAPGTGRTPLHVAACDGKEVAAKALMLAGADVNTLDANKDTPLHMAIEGGHVRLAEDLLLRGAGANVKGSNGDYPMHLAAQVGQDGVVRALGHAGADLNCLDSEGLTPLGWAVRNDRASTVNVLLDDGADVNFKCGLSETTVLHRAALENKTSAISALVEAGADIEARDKYGLTPLSSSIYRDACSAMLALLHLGANVNAKDNLGWTPLHGACMYRKADAADLLLRWGADETIVDDDGETPSQYIQDIAEADEEDHPRLERLFKLLAHAPQDRAWRRRGFMVMCRAHPERVRLVVDTSDTAPPAVGQPQERPSRRARRGQVKVEIGGAHGGGGGGGAGSSSRRAAGRRAGGEGNGGGFDGMAAWVMGVQDKLFRSIVGFL